MKKPPDFAGGGYGGAKPQADIPAIANIDILPPSAFRPPPSVNLRSSVPKSNGRDSTANRPSRAAETNFHRGVMVMLFRMFVGRTAQATSSPNSNRQAMKSFQRYFTPTANGRERGCRRNCRVPRSSGLGWFPGRPENTAAIECRHKDNRAGRGPRRTCWCCNRFPAEQLVLEMAGAPGEPRLEPQ